MAFSRSVLLLVLSVLVASVALASVSFDLTQSPNIRAAERIHRYTANGAHEDSIEWRWDAEGSLSLLAHLPRSATAKSQLFTFPAEATMADVATSKLATKLMHLRSSEKKTVACQFVDGHSHSLPAATVVGPYLTKQAAQLSLQCQIVSGPRKMHQPKVYSFHQYVRPTFAPNEYAAASRLRRLVTGEDKEYPLEAGELLSDCWQGLVGWAEAFAKYHWGALPAYPDYTTSTTQTGRWHLNNGAVLKRGATFGPESDSEVRIAIAADWAAGTMEADYCQQVMMTGNSSAFDPHWTLHLGDIYYVGGKEFVQSNCLGMAPSGVQKGVTWPHGSIGSFAVEGNHESYARSIGFFDTFLPTLGVDGPSGSPSGQQAGFVSMENAYWRVILLDTGFRTYDWIPKNDNRNNTQPQAVVDWLVNEVDIGNPDDTRGIIFMTHHQVESAFEEPYQATPNQIAALMPAGRTVIWLWGHEHRLSFYKVFTLPNATVPLNVYGRCIGNSGFPASVGPIPPRAAEAGLEAYDDRLYTLETGFFNTSVSYNGFTRLVLEKNAATITYSSLATDPTTGLLSNTLQTDLVQELFQVDGNGNVALGSFAVIDPEMTIINPN